MSYPDQSLTLNEYQRAAARTLTAEGPQTERLAWNALGLTGEAGEVADEVKKAVWHGKPLDKEALCKELGDVLWYLSAVASVLGLTLEQVAEANIAKLRARFPNGWDPKASRAKADQHPSISEQMAAGSRKDGP